MSFVMFFLLCVMRCVICERKKIDGPKYFLIGVQKGGTTSLHDLLVHHKEICSPITKELHYFDSDRNYKHGPSFYTSLFRESCDHGDYIDSTPDYFANPLAPFRMNESMPQGKLREKKLILILREPVKREYSLYGHLLRHCLDNMHHGVDGKTLPAEGWDSRELCHPNGYSAHCRKLQCAKKAHLARPGRLKLAVNSFAEYIDSDEFDASKSFYIEHLRRFLQVFRRDQIFIANFERLIYETPTLVSRLSKFLGITDNWGSDVKLPFDNTGRGHEVLDCASMKNLAALYEPYNEELYQFMKETADQASPYEPPFQPFPTPNYECERS